MQIISGNSSLTETAAVTMVVSCNSQYANALLNAHQHGVTQEDILRKKEAAQATKDAVFDFASLANSHLTKVKLDGQSSDTLC